MDLHLSRPFQVAERVKLEPNVSVFNVFNWANFGGAGYQLKRRDGRRAGQFAE
jgi:hypothetical protein